MKEVVIISSFSESCGNAYFTEILLKGLNDLGYNSKCLSLDLALTQSLEEKIRKKADLHVEELCKINRLAAGVNIQFEAGLYGTLPSDIFKRFKMLLSSNSNISVTLHSPRLLSASSGIRDAIRLLFQGKILSAIKNYMDLKKGMIHYILNNKVVKEIVRLNVPIIVHTNRAKEQIKTLYNYDNVYVHPLKFVKADFKSDYSKLAHLKNSYGLASQDKVVGMFGYISSYKGHTAALKAMTRLPNEYKLLIFGRVHPQSIKLGSENDSYMEFLNIYIDVNKLNDRVYFVGEVNTIDFIDYAAAVDCVWLPYLEVGQDGSGIASICCDVSDNILASTAFSFDELLKLIPYPAVRRFDIGNTIELAQKTITSGLILNKNFDKNKIFNLNSQAKVYEHSIFGGK